MMLLILRVVQTEKKASRPSGKAVLLVSSGVAPNSDLPSLRTSTFKRCVTFPAMGGTVVLIANAVRSRMFSSLHQYLPVSLYLFRSISSLTCFLFILHLHSTPGPSPSRQPSWRPRSRRHDWRTFRGYALGTRSKSCWTCRGTSRHNLGSFLVDNGWHYGHTGHWFLNVLEYIRIAKTGLLLPHQFGDFTLASFDVAGPWNDCSYVMVAERG